jgi:hypothetical protein
MPDPPDLTKPGFHLLLCGPSEAWPAGDGSTPGGALAADFPGLVTVHRVADGSAAHYLVRPDGYVGYRASGTDLSGLRDYLSRWLPGGRRPADARRPAR